ncbi:protease [Enemella dayhoffiae]|uniref:Protease n=1 Tax=Enemella dayhoffiae TaxID=2016507 RepID=A0A255GVG2_9ACTN|nr:protease [Enemella dayhoffiae]
MSLTRQTWAALASALCFVILALLIALVPVPYVVYSKGRAYDVLGTRADGRPLLDITGVPTYPTTGQLDMTTVSVTRSDAATSLPEAILAYWLPRRDALPRDSVYERGKTSEQVRTEERQMMDTSQQDAVVAALRAANQPVTEMAVVSAVTVSGPANGRLRPGDLFLSVDGLPVRTPDDVRRVVQRRSPGDVVKLQVLRDRVEQRVDVTTTPSRREPKIPVLGVDIGIGYRYEPQVDFGVSADIGGPSAGLVFALGIYDRITPGDLMQGREVAGTGTITASGSVGPIGGIQEKIAGAEEAGASVFIVPAANCRDLTGLQTRLNLIRAASLTEAVDGLRAAADPATAASVPRC